MKRAPDHAIRFLANPAMADAHGSDIIAVFNRMVDI